MKYNVVNTKNVHSTQRFDPSFHLSDAITLREKVENVPFEKVSIADATENVFLGNIFSRIFVKDAEHGIPYLAASDTVLANLDTGRYLSKKQASILSYLMLKKDWIVVTCSGTIGNVTYTNSSFENHIATHDLIRIVPNDEKILRGYLYAFLASKYGYNQLTQSQFGGVVKHINAEHVRNIKVPCFDEFFQEEVNDLIQEATRLREKAADALEYAISFFNTLFPIPFKDNCLGKVSSKEIMTSINKRFEASFHISEGKDIDKYIKEHYEWKSLGEVCSNISRPDMFKRYYVKNGITFLGGADIFLATPDSEKRLSKTKTENISQLVIKEGTILLPRSGTIGNVAWAHAGHAQKLASEDVIRLLPNDILRAGYVYAFLASKYGKLLIQRYIFGSVIQHVEPPHLKLIPVPIIDQKTMDDIHDKIMLYSSAMGKAIEFEQKAINMVEREIEKWNKH
ncbi:restriction endonuclease subunit S [Bacteroides xylanisolvens]|uniref:methylation-associated defense system restriction endonuclease subunit S MAD5 n=1 Tax=Bacteroides xylanisolvens TaxID=371601 RepID=UPI001CDB6B15|nr:restriction endonuclease subunit S [Bacteroides xylanisolvens]MCA4482061.1 restriction endonuclease subunit S [Bacteroides xylanisolvens]